MSILSSTFHTLRFWGSAVFLSLVLGTAALAVRLIDPSGNTSHRLASFWGRLMCRWNGIRVEVQGLENARPDRAQVFMANHQSYFDIFALSGFLPVQLRWMAKASLFRIPFVGWSMYAADYIPVLRTDRKHAYQAFLKAVEKLKAGCSIVIFPEGTRSADGTIGEFKKGGTLLATRSGVPMVPVTILGTGSIIQKGSGVVHPGKVKLILSPPLSGKDIEENKEEDVLGTIREIICRNHRLHSGAASGPEAVGKKPTDRPRDRSS